MRVVVCFEYIGFRVGVVVRTLIWEVEDLGIVFVFIF